MGIEVEVHHHEVATGGQAEIGTKFDTLTDKARRIEVRFPDAMMMAGIDGIQNKIDPGEAVDHNLYELSKEEAKDLPSVAYSLENALNHLREDHDFLLVGDVFTQNEILRYIDLKKEEVDRTRVCTHPIELELYYDM